MTRPQHQPSNADIRALSQASLLRLGLFLSIALLVGTSMPQGMQLMAVSSMLWVGAIVSALVAAIMGEPLWRAPHLTRWDESALLALLSLGIGMFVDQQAVMQHMQALQNRP